jgi:hypothetical protein
MDISGHDARTAPKEGFPENPDNSLTFTLRLLVFTEYSGSVVSENPKKAQLHGFSIYNSGVLSPTICKDPTGQRSS